VDEVRKLTDGRGADVIITAAASGAAQVAGAADGRAAGQDQLLRRPA
jgi:hypothetical protein